MNGIAVGRRETFVRFELGIEGFDSQAAEGAVRVDAELGVVVVTTEAPWRADANGLEEGLGVPGWALLETETLDDNEAPAEVRAVDAVRSKLEALPEVVVGVAVPEEI